MPDPNQLYICRRCELSFSEAEADLRGLAIRCPFCFADADPDGGAGLDEEPVRNPTGVELYGSR